MKTIAITSASFALLVPFAVLAQTFTCPDETDKINYSGKKCSDVGLKAAGEVKDKLHMNPAYRRPARTEGSWTPPPASAPAVQAPAPEPAAAAESDNPGRRCFTVKTAKGNVTRCNDAPDADAPPGNP